jgi:hypothetical protein
MNASHMKSEKTLNIWNIMHEVEMQNKLKHGAKLLVTSKTKQENKKPNQTTNR